MPCDSVRVTEPMEMIRAIYTNNVNFAAQAFITTNLPLHSLLSSLRQITKPKEAPKNRRYRDPNVRSVPAPLREVGKPTDPRSRTPQNQQDFRVLSSSNKHTLIESPKRV